MFSEAIGSNNMHGFLLVLMLIQCAGVILGLFYMVGSWVKYSSNYPVYPDSTFTLEHLTAPLWVGTALTGLIIYLPFFIIFGIYSMFKEAINNTFKDSK